MRGIAIEKYWEQSNLWHPAASRGRQCRNGAVYGDVNVRGRSPASLRVKFPPWSAISRPIIDYVATIDLVIGTAASVPPSITSLDESATETTALPLNNNSIPKSTPNIHVKGPGKPPRMIRARIKLVTPLTTNHSHCSQI